MYTTFMNRKEAQDALQAIRDASFIEGGWSELKVKSNESHWRKKGDVLVDKLLELMKIEE